MSRPLRIEYRDAWYHVMSRARAGHEAFPAKEDYYNFIDFFKDTSDMFNMRIAAYCLITTHYRLLIQTPDANFSRCMSKFNLNNYSSVSTALDRIKKNGSKKFKKHYVQISKLLLR